MKRDGIVIEELYPDLTPEEQREAEENLLAYLKVIIRIADEIRRDPERYRELCALTGVPYDPTMVTGKPIIEF